MKVACFQYLKAIIRLKMCNEEFKFCTRIAHEHFIIIRTAMEYTEREEKKKEVSYELF